VLLHGTLVVGVSQTLWRWTEGATYIRQGGHHVGHWPTFFLYRYYLQRLYHRHRRDRYRAQSNMTISTLATDGWTVIFRAANRNPGGWTPRPSFLRCTKYYNVPKTCHLWLGVGLTSTYINRFWQFLAKMLVRKSGIKRHFIFPRHPTNASALPRKRKTRKFYIFA